MKKSGFVFALIVSLTVAGAGYATVGAHQGYGSRPGVANRLSGTYELDRIKSDNSQRIVTQATRALPMGDRDRVTASLMARLDSPTTLSIDLRGRSVTIMSSNAPRLIFDADGRDRTEPGPNGRMITTHADVMGDALTVSTSGNRSSDFMARFEPVPGGLRVTRRLDTDNLPNPVVVQSVYRRVSEEPRWDVYNPGRPAPMPPPPAPRAGYVAVPDGTPMTVRLERSLDERTRAGERFTVSVMEPVQYRGAIIDGVVSNAEGRNGHPTLDFDFNHIRLVDGRQGDFDAQIESVRTPNGQTIRVDRAGNVQDRKTNNDTVQNGAVGAALGAIIGAIAGGGKGAAIGAVVGGGAGVVISDSNNLSLPAGSTMAISSFGPRR